MSLVRAALPAPLTSAALFALWVVLARGPSPGHLLLAAGFALIVPQFTSRLWPKPIRVRRPLVVVRYLLLVGYHVLKSNLEVALGVLFWRRRRPHAAFVVVPLDLRDPVGLSALAIVTTVVPGTVWSELALDRSALLLHVWDVPDEQAFIARYKHTYERPLREIFE